MGIHVAFELYCFIPSSKGLYGTEHKGGQMYSMFKEKMKYKALSGRG